MAAALGMALGVTGGRFGLGSPIVPAHGRASYRLAPCRLRCAGVEESAASSLPSTSGREGESDGDGGTRGRDDLDAPAAGRPAGRFARTPESTDWISSSITRRFGLGAGLAWVGFLAFGVISEQIKTRTEVFLEEQGTRDVEDAEEVVLPIGIRYADLRVGGGSSPQRGDLVLVDLTGRVSDAEQPFVDTTAGEKRALAFVFGSRPYSNGMCEGLESVLVSMRAGGKRRAIIPAELGFGEAGAQFPGDMRVPGGAELEYVVELRRVSIAPAYHPVREELEVC